MKTTGSKGIHVYVPIVRGPTQKQVWTFAKELADRAGRAASGADYRRLRVAKRPQGRVLVDYNQNAWGRTLASIYSVRPPPSASVSTPVTWEEIEQGVAIEDFRIDNVRDRIAKSATCGSRCSQKLAGPVSVDTWVRSAPFLRSDEQSWNDGPPRNGRGGQKEPDFRGTGLARSGAGWVGPSV